MIGRGSQTDTQHRMSESSSPWPCSRCQATGIRNVAAGGYCVAHLAALYWRIRPEAWAWRGAGVGLPISGLDSSGEADLACSLCAATWTGAAFSDCPWCVAAAEQQTQWQAQAVLTPPQVDPDDRRYDAALAAWRRRLDVAVDSELVTVEQAERAWCREVDCEAA